MFVADRFVMQLINYVKEDYKCHSYHSMDWNFILTVVSQFSIYLIAT